MVSSQGIKTDPEKVAVVATWPMRHSVEDVCSFHGFCSYYRCFVEVFATICHPLTQLTAKGVWFTRSEECEWAFQQLKGALATAPVLTYTDPQAPMLLDTVVSRVGLGMVLSQRDTEDRERVLGYASRALTWPERNYCITRRELLGFVFSIRKFQAYLVGAKFIVRTNHSTLCWLLSAKEPEGQMAHLIQVLETYEFEIFHRPGKKYGNKNGLSRGSCHQCGREEQEGGGGDVSGSVIVTILWTQEDWGVIHQWSARS